MKKITKKLINEYFKVAEQYLYASDPLAVIVDHFNESFPDFDLDVKIWFLEDVDNYLATYFDKRECVFESEDGTIDLTTGFVTQTAALLRGSQLNLLFSSNLSINVAQSYLIESISTVYSTNYCETESDLFKYKKCNKVLESGTKLAEEILLGHVMPEMINEENCTLIFEGAISEEVFEESD